MLEPNFNKYNFNKYNPLTIDNIIQEINKARNKGTIFEEISRFFLLTENEWKNKFKEIWFWNEFPYKDQFGRSDVGIDLVALDFDNQYCAIQCKCYNQNTQITKQVVDTFLSTSSRSFEINNSDNRDRERVNFSHRLWISTTNDWSENAREALKNQQIPCDIIDLEYLRTSEVNWEGIVKGDIEEASIKKREPREYQKQAIEKTHEYFKTNDRGKLIMACGTGKTFTALKIAEKQTDCNGIVLFLVPSINLIKQTKRAWYNDQQYDNEILDICICSDSTASHLEEDIFYTKISGATTDPQKIQSLFNKYKNEQEKAKKNQEHKMIVVFSTYQSIDKVKIAQEYCKQNGIQIIFDLIICDEAHRTTGFFGGKDDNGKTIKEQSNFTRINDENYIFGHKRLYMTATPRMYKSDIKKKAEEKDIVAYSMDDEKIYGKEIYRIGFGQAVELGCLSDYKVLILAQNENDTEEQKEKGFVKKIIEFIKKQQQEEEDKKDEKVIEVNELSKIIGCVNALSKKITFIDKKYFSNNKEPMKRAIAFCSSIKASKKVSELLNAYSEYLVSKKNQLKIVSEHIDGTMSSIERDKKLHKLSEDVPDGECRILTNARCLSEGVDIANLDAIIFLADKQSKIDIIQQVGRVMRIAEGKKFGYIIIPVLLKKGLTANETLDKTENYRIIWNILNALRAHDDRLDIEVEKIKLGVKSDRINFGLNESDGIDDESQDEIKENFNKELKEQGTLFKDYKYAFYAKLVEKVGDRLYWPNWAIDTREIIENFEKILNGLLQNDICIKQKFESFIDVLKKIINPSVTKDQAISFLAQNFISKPIFDSLFGYEIKNKVSEAMGEIMKIIENYFTLADKKALQKYYKFVKEKVFEVKDEEAKQNILKTIYNDFFSIVFPSESEKNGIVYTPVEVVDFMIKSVNDIFAQEFNKKIDDKGVEILDPFTGTGTFVVRLLQSGLISHENLPYKFKNELRANEIMMLAYYIASVNIETAYHNIMSKWQKEQNKKEGKLEAEVNIPYETFDKILFTDTFQLYEDTCQQEENNKAAETTYLLPEGVIKPLKEITEQRQEQINSKKIQIIIGNPPYSAGQKSANDNNQNNKYEKLDKRVREKYNGTAMLQRALQDTYVKAFRYATDKIDGDGMIAYITNNGWIDAIAFDGFRKCLEKEFDKIYVIDLRGGIRGKAGDLLKKEGGNVFNIMAGNAITILVKKKCKTKEKADIYYCKAADYAKREEKFEWLKNLNVLDLNNFTKITPNEHGDWLGNRADVFSKWTLLASRTESDCVFDFLTYGISTGRDKWCYNFNREKVKQNICGMIDFYNKERERYKKEENKKEVITFVDNDKTKCSWTCDLRKSLKKNIEIIFNECNIVTSYYRPFCKQKFYLDSKLNERQGGYLKLYPSQSTINQVINYNMRSGNPIITDIINDNHSNGDSLSLSLSLSLSGSTRKSTNNVCICCENDKQQWNNTVYITNYITNNDIIRHCQLLPMFYYESTKRELYE